ncbi:hypothetical protein BDF21DRAFT_448346 [Thamnidium elegans]|nr:hypothetical protein BDF21DRAFT_448346 [Thamnidium elegans]
MTGWAEIKQGNRKVFFIGKSQVAYNKLSQIECSKFLKINYELPSFYITSSCSENETSMLLPKRTNLFLTNYRNKGGSGSSSSGSSDSDPKVKRRRRLTYFGGDGIKQWKPPTALIIEKIDVTSVLKRYKEKNIKMAEKLCCICDIYTYKIHTN